MRPPGGIGPLKVALLDDWQGRARELADWSRLPAGASLTVFTTPVLDEDGLVARLAPFDAVIAMRERTAFPASVIRRLPALRLIASTGLRNAAIDLEACEAAGITVTGSRGAPTGLDATAETAWALILALAKRLPASDRALRDGRWQPEWADALGQRVLALAGLGRVGQRMARLGVAFGMRVIAWSPSLTAGRAAAVGATSVDVDTLFREADWLSLHLSAVPATRHFVDAARLSSMKPTARLINTARGALVDESALVAALREGRLAGAGLDVFEREPLPRGHPLAALPQVVLTPHLGYATGENLGAFLSDAIEQLRAWHAGEPVRPLQR